MLLQKERTRPIDLGNVGMLPLSGSGMADDGPGGGQPEITNGDRAGTRSTRS